MKKKEAVQKGFSGVIFTLALVLYAVYLVFYPALRTWNTNIGAVSLIPMLMMAYLGIRYAVIISLINHAAHVLLIVLVLHYPLAEVIASTFPPLAALSLSTILVSTVLSLSRKNRTLMLREQKLREQMEQAMKEKDLLMRELNHRTKNNLQLMHSLIGLNLRNVPHEECRTLIRDIQNRIQTMSLLHQRLNFTGSIQQVQLSTYLETLARDIYHTLLSDGSSIRLVFDLDEITTDSEQAVNCGLFLNEVFTNAIKHAFPLDREEAATIEVRLKAAGGTVALSICDNGIGLPEPSRNNSGRSMGMTLIQLIAEKNLKGSLDVTNGAGSCFTVRFASRR